MAGLFLYVCKQTIHKGYGWISPKFLGLRMQNIRGIIFICTQIYEEDFQICISVPLNPSPSHRKTNPLKTPPRLGLKNLLQVK